MEYSWNLHGIWLEFEWSWNSAEICMVYDWNMVGIWMEYEYILGNWMEYDWNMNGIWITVIYRHGIWNHPCGIWMEYDYFPYSHHIPCTRFHIPWWCFLIIHIPFIFPQYSIHIPTTNSYSNHHPWWGFHIPWLWFGAIHIPFIFPPSSIQIPTIYSYSIHIPTIFHLDSTHVFHVFQLRADICQAFRRISCNSLCPKQHPQCSSAHSRLFGEFPFGI